MSVTKPKSYVRGQHAQACCALLDVLYDAGALAVSVWHDKGVLHVRLNDAEKDSPKVPAEFHGYTTEIHQDPNPARLAHVKVANGCVHTRWEHMQYEKRGIVPNRACQEPEYVPQQEVNNK